MAHLGSRAARSQYFTVRLNDGVASGLAARSSDHYESTWCRLNLIAAAFAWLKHWASPVSIFATVIQVLVFALAVVVVVIQGRALYRLALDRERWERESRLSVPGKLLFAVLCILVSALILVGILWRMFSGPVPPAHEWLALSL